MKIINGKLLAETLNKDLSKRISIYKEKFTKSPHLTVILVGNNKASQIYVKNKEKKALEVGIKSSVIRLSSDICENNLIDVIEQCNHDKTIDGILVQLPLPNHINSNKVIDKIAIETTSELLVKLIGTEVNNSSISAIVDDLSKRNGNKQHGS